MTHYLRAARWLPTCTLTFGLMACGASAPTDELVDARRAYDDAEDGPARNHRPGELRAAKRALDRAENAHDDDPGSEREKRLAEIAEHRADVADARGEAAQAEAAAQTARLRAQREAREMRPAEQRAVMAKAERPRAKDEVVVAEPGERPMVRAEASADSPADKELLNLSHASAVRQDERGTVIILSGALLFPSGKTELSDTAEDHLSRVAEALKEQPESRKFKVEGYTDASGSQAMNKQLSAKRAAAVAEYLTDHGIDEDRVTYAGYGEKSPIADNDSDEGRASNRRVEIVIVGSEAKPDDDDDDDDND